MADGAMPEKRQKASACRRESGNCRAATAAKQKIDVKRREWRRGAKGLLLECGFLEIERRAGGARCQASQNSPQPITWPGK
jgi:hypothetical protein